MSHQVENKFVSERIARIHVDLVDSKQIDFLQTPRTVNLLLLIINSFTDDSLFSRLLIVNGRGRIEGVRSIVSFAIFVICPFWRINLGGYRVECLAICIVKIKVPDIDTALHINLSCGLLDKRMLRMAHQL